MKAYLYLSLKIWLSNLLLGALAVWVVALLAIETKSTWLFVRLIFYPLFISLPLIALLLMIVMLADSRCLPQVVKVILVNLLCLVLSGLYLLILSSLRRNDEVIHECWKDREYMYGMAGYVIVVNLNLAYHLMSSFERDSRYERKRKLWQRRYPDSADPAEEEQKTSTRHKQQPPDPGTIFPGDDQPGEAGK